MKKKYFVIILITTFFSILLSPLLTESLWHIETLDQKGDVGWHCSIAVDPKNGIHISYADISNNKLKYTYFNGKHWTITTVDHKPSGQYSSIALDHTMNPHISYSGDGLRYAAWDGHQWHIQQISDNALRYNTSLVIGSNHTRHIGFITWRGLQYATFNKKKWDVMALTRKDNPMDCSVTLTQFNQPYIAYTVNRHDDVRLLKRRGEKWVAEHPPATAAIDGYWPSIALDSKGQPHIAFWETNYGHNSFSDLKYYHFNNQKWILETPDQVQDTGWYPSLKLDNQNHAHISYHNHTRWNLNYATNRSGQWKTYPVDTSGFVGYSSSLALDRNQQPCIAYYDVHQKDLKFARWFPGNFQVSGKVVTSKKQPKAGLWIHLVGHSIQALTQTDSQGRFTFQQVPKGTYNLAPDQATLYTTPKLRTLQIDSNLLEQNFIWVKE